MSDQELLQAIRAITREELNPINQRLNGIDQHLDSIDQRLDALEESLEETRNSVNLLIEWSEKVSMAATFPLPDIDER